LCPSISTLFWVMNSIPKMQSIPPKVETSKSTFPLQFPSWRGTSFACNIVGWGTPSAKCTSFACNVVGWGTPSAKCTSFAYNVVGWGTPSAKCTSFACNVVGWGTPSAKCTSFVSNVVGWGTPSAKCTSFACNVVGWGTPSAKCTSMGALSSSKWSSIFSALSRVMKLWKAPMSKRHNTSTLTTFLFKKTSRLHSGWATLALRAITLEPPFLILDLEQSLE